MANHYQLVASNITATSVQITVISATNPSTTAATIMVACFASSHGGATEYLNDPGTAMAQNVGTVTFSSLDPETEYAASVRTPYSSDTVRFTTLVSPDTPRIATQQQWEDISSKVKAKADNSAFTGTDGVNAGTAGLVPAPATTDAGKFLKADGTWGTAGGGGPTVVQTTGTSTADVMSQKAVTDELYPQYATKTKNVIGIGNYSNIADYGTTKIGIGRVTLGNYSAYAVAIHGGDSGGTVNAISALGIWAGNGGTVTGHSGVAIGSSASVSAAGGIAIGRDSSATSQGEFNIGSSSTSYGYNNTNYRLLTGVHDGQSAHDAATKGQLDGLITMTTTDPGEGSALAANTYLAVYGGDPVILDYATSEINTGTKWINGDTIYKKTVSVGNLPNATMATTAHNISNFATLVKLEGSFTNGSNSAPIPYASPTTTKCVQAYADATNITIVTGEDRSAYSGYVTLYYTKSS